MASASGNGEKRWQHNRWRRNRNQLAKAALKRRWRLAGIS
jgi:hypothetical protein